MFVESITLPRDDWMDWTERLGMLANPPAALVAAIAWESGDGNVTSIALWDSPEAVADFFVERVHQIVAADGEPATKPTRHGQPVAVYVRGLGPA